jgi:hypothetical protein
LKLSSEFYVENYKNGLNFKKEIERRNKLLIKSERDKINF